jgi:4-amino-4-deoxy-L-arabinose transferase-like glycosyltransferase
VPSISRLAPKIRAPLSSPLALSLLGVTLVAIAVRVPFIGTAVSAPDTIDYMARMDLLVEGQGFLNAIRTPGFLFVLAAFHALGADPVVSVVVMQNLIGMVMPAAVLAVGWRFFNRPTAIVGGFLAAASPLLVLSEQYALTDYLFGVLLFGGAALLAEAALRVHMDRPSRRWLIAAGAAFGFATLVRGNGQFAIVAIPLALLLALPGWRVALRSAGIAVLAMLVVVAPWVIHNIVNFGTPQVTTLGGQSLYLRIIDHDRVPPPDDSANGRLARRIYDNVYAYAPPGQERNSGLLVAGALEERGMDNVEATSVMTGLALEAISQHPDIYLSNTREILGEFLTMYNPDHDLFNQGMNNTEYVRFSLTTLGEATLEGRGAVPGNSSVTRTPWELAEVVGQLVYLFSLAGIVALVLPFIGPRRSRIGASILLTMVVVGILTSAASIHFEPRFDLPYAWMVWLLMAAASTFVLRLALRAIRFGVSRWPEEGLAREPLEPDEPTGGG